MPEKDKIHELQGWLSVAWSENIFNHCGPLAYHWNVADEEQYKLLGEDPEADDCPIILVHEDGTFAEIEPDIMAWVTTPEERAQKREYWRQYAENLKKYQAKKEKKPEPE